MSRKIVVIEDNKDIRKGIVEILELASYTVFEAENGRQGIDLAIQHTPDVILCNIDMPDLDGYGVLLILSRNPKTSGISFIFLTGKRDQIDFRKGMEMGADDYLIKPFEEVDLLKAVEGRIRRRELQQFALMDSIKSIYNNNSGKDYISDLQNNLKNYKSRLYKKKQVIYYEGDPGSGLYFVLSGAVKTVKTDEDGHELITGIFLAGNYFGINSMLSNQPFPDTASALENSSICLVPKEHMETLLNSHPGIAKEFIQLLAQDNRDKEEQLLQFAYHSVRKRMAEVLMRLYHKHVKFAPNFEVTREDLSALSCMASETVSRTLSDFKSEGLLEKTGSTITILSPDRLTKMKN
ncbi:response regulator [Pedobacter gandavensis]|uniref:Response regulator n=1 Tax=Pedobacter gandavensis TaxID=2679963 RepID=A0ABR6EQK0_9SPHI|nr:response regulator [Pedobacter gandavensis]MBB2147528.1 response regulator [Pedobacter gandavensis]